MTPAVPFWFGPEPERLFGWLHVPDSAQARLGVVLCPPLGYEHICAHHAYRDLALALADAGFAVLRFDMHGTGDSGGSDVEPDRVGAWRRSIRAAHDELARRTDAPRAAVAMRATALILAAMAADADFEQLVLWDPVASGRAYVKELKLLRMVGMGVPEHPRTDGSLESAGVEMTTQTVEDLEALDLAGVCGRLAPRILLLTRPGRNLAARPLAAIEAACQRLDQLPALGQEHLIDVTSANSQPPRETSRAIVEWLDAAASGTTHRVTVGASADAVISGIRETARSIGDDDIFVITAEARGGGQGPWVIGLNNATDHHIGPSRLWVEVAREVAARGGRFARVDLSGIGDSGTRPGQRRHLAYASEHFDDAVTIASSLSPEDPQDVVFVGLCSGAYLAVDLGALFGAHAIVPINPVLDHRPGDLAVPGDASSAPVRAMRPTRLWLRPLSDSGLGDHIRERLPALAWTVLDRTRIHPSPARGLRLANARGVETVLVYGAADVGLATLQRRARADLRALQASPRFRLVTVPGMDHALMLTEPHARLRRLLVEHVSPPVTSLVPPPVAS